jgi:proton glutamate symport protein
MKRIKLHWQILIALIIGVLYGVLTPSYYQITRESIEKLREQKVPNHILEKIDCLSDHVYEKRSLISSAIDEVIDQPSADLYKSHIIIASRFNKFVNYVSWMGDIFLRLLKMIIIPLIISSIISGVTNLSKGDNLGRLGLKTIFYYISTSLLAILTGLFMVNLLRPGDNLFLVADNPVDPDSIIGLKALKETMIEIVPENIFQALSNTQMLSIIFFSIVFGFYITRVSDKNRIILSDIFNAVFEVMMRITLFIIRFTPIGIFGIVAKVVSEQDNLLHLAERMGLYMGAVMLALFVHACITLPLLLRFLGKARPGRHFNAVISPLLTAFSTSSSGATLPLTIDAVENNSGVSNKISSFTLPLGATINMDGTALYECVAAIFIAQAYGIELSFASQVVVVITALLASIGAAAVPMAGLVMITIILTAVGLPLEGIGLILAVDRILDMFRTATNVWSDTCGAVIIAKSEGETLKV